MLDFSDRTRIGISILTSAADEPWDFSGIQIVIRSQTEHFPIFCASNTVADLQKLSTLRLYRCEKFDRVKKKTLMKY